MSASIDPFDPANCLARICAADAIVMEPDGSLYLVNSTTGGCYLVIASAPAPSSPDDDAGVRNARLLERRQARDDAWRAQREGATFEPLPPWFVPGDAALDNDDACGAA